MERDERQYVKRTQRNYSYSFKLQIVDEIDRGEISLSEAKEKYGIQGDATIRNWVKKFSKFDKSYDTKTRTMQSPEKKVMELEQKIKLLEQRNKSLERQVDQADKKAIFFDMMIDIAEEEFKIPIRKKSLSGQLINTKKPTKKI